MFEASAGGQSLGDAGEPAVPAAQEFREVIGGRLAFDVRAERENDLDFFGCRLDPADQWRDP